jgi:hypothetical protein
MKLSPTSPELDSPARPTINRSFRRSVTPLAWVLFLSLMLLGLCAAQPFGTGTM